MSSAESIDVGMSAVSAEDVVGRQIDLWDEECGASGRLELGVLTDEELAALDMEPVPQAVPFPALSEMDPRERSVRIDSARRMLRARGLDFDGDPASTLDPALGALLRIRCDANTIVLCERVTEVGTDWCVVHALASHPIGLLEEVSADGMHSYRLEARRSLVPEVVSWVAPVHHAVQDVRECLDFTVPRSALTTEDDVLSDLAGATVASAVSIVKGDGAQDFSVFSSDHFLVVGSSVEEHRAVRYRSVNHEDLTRRCANIIGD